MTQIRSVWVPGLPHLLQPERSHAWEKLNDSMTALGAEIQAWAPERIVLYSSQWMSVLGTSYQAQPRPKGVHVDENWHEWGDLSFDFPVDGDLSAALAKETETSGFPARTVNYEGFPVDTGTIVALRFLDPKGKIPVSLVSSWVYADAKSSQLLGAAARRVVERSGRKTLVVASSLLTTRYFTEEIVPNEDKLSSSTDDQWNRKILGHMEAGALASITALAGQFTKECAPDMQFNAFHWLNGFWGETKVVGRVLAYGPLWGTGAAVAELSPKKDKMKPQIEPIEIPGAPKPLGNYSHAVGYGDLIFVSGIAARDPKTDKIPGLVLSEGGEKKSYDIRAETRATLENIRTILEAAGSSLEKVIEVNVYLIDMKDFGAYNEAYSEVFNSHQSHRPARTTVAVAGLPGKISIEMKVIAAK